MSLENREQTLITQLKADLERYRTLPKPEKLSVGVEAPGYIVALLKNASLALQKIERENATPDEKGNALLILSNALSNFKNNINFILSLQSSSASKEIEKNFKETTAGIFQKSSVVSLERRLGEIRSVLKENYPAHFVKQEVMDGLAKIRKDLSGKEVEVWDKLVAKISKISVSETMQVSFDESAIAKIGDELTQVYFEIKKTSPAGKLENHLKSVLMSNSFKPVLTDMRERAQQFVEKIADAIKNTAWDKLRNPTGVKEMKKIIENRSDQNFDYIEAKGKLGKCGKDAETRFAPNREPVVKSFYNAVADYKDGVELDRIVRDLPKLPIAREVESQEEVELKEITRKPEM